jgi:hypothetical protein
MRYRIEQGDQKWAEFGSLDAALATVAEWLGRELTDDMRGACPDEGEWIGIECWMPYIDNDHVPDGTVFVYRHA